MTNDLAPSQPSAVPERAYRRDILVRFADCDPAGIVFYPRFLEMFNNLVEDWFREELGLPFSELISGGRKLPTAHLEVDFLAPSIMGEVLQASLVVRAIGRTSIRLEIVLRGPDGQERVRGQKVVVVTGPKNGGSAGLTDELRARMSKFLVAE